MKTKIIIVSGKAQSGKDTACDYMMSKITQSTKLSCQKFTFAYELKRICSSVFNFDINLLNGTNEDKNTISHIRWCDLPIKTLNIKNKEFMTYREFMQVFGTDICRKIYSDCWCQSIITHINESQVDFAFISDARFPNEIEFFQNYDVNIIKLLRNPIKSLHSSETALDNYEYPNCSTVDNHIMDIKAKNKILDLIITNKGWI